MIERLPASKLLARRLPAGLPLRADGATKLTARPRRLNPVDERLLFFSKSSGAGKVPLVDLLVIAISRGDPGEGGELERVVVEDLFMEKRRPLGGGPVAVDDAPPSEVSEAGADSVMPEPMTWELDRRKRFDKDRLKLPVEPRVERRDSGAGVKSCCCCCCCELEVVAEAGVALGADVGGTEVGGLALCKAVLLGLVDGTL